MIKKNFFLLAVLCTMSIAQDRCQRSPEENPYFLPRLQEIAADCDGVTSIVMLGNSITAGGDWQLLLDDSTVYNMGIGGDNLTGFQSRIDLVIRARPRMCFIMGGINDIYDGCAADMVYARYRRIIDRIIAAGIEPVLQSTLFVSSAYKNARSRNAEVRLLNRLLKENARKRGLVFIDLNRILAPKGELLPRFTTDGVHLTAAAYELWAHKVLDTIKNGPKAAPPLGQK